LGRSGMSDHAMSGFFSSMLQCKAGQEMIGKF
jgi:hypothetical protein